MTALVDLFGKVVDQIARSTARDIADAPTQFSYSRFMPDGRYLQVGRTILVRDKANAAALVEALNRLTAKMDEENRRRIYGGSTDQAAYPGTRRADLKTPEGRARTIERIRDILRPHDEPITSTEVAAALDRELGGITP